ncbi:MAG: hypothetical protein JWM23_265 [Microbacteriaceae bacterium]|jgi:hypothetical protein|nr:hypothetical protein [Microbacteriaceae bacterium]
MAERTVLEHPGGPATSVGSGWPGNRSSTDATGAVARRDLTAEMAGARSV